MNTKWKIGAVILLIALAVPAALLAHAGQATLVSLGVAMLGAVTVTYGSFQDGSGPHGGYTGGTTAPTLAQSAGVNVVVATVAMGDTDTTATITHNMNVTAAQLAALQPFVTIGVTTPGTVVPLLSYALTSANVVTITKGSLTGSGGTYVVVIRRPGTPGY